MVEVAENSTTILSASKRLQILQEGVLAAIQRKITQRTVFEADREAGLPLNSNLLTSNQTM